MGLLKSKSKKSAVPVDASSEDEAAASKRHKMGNGVTESAPPGDVNSALNPLNAVAAMAAGAVPGPGGYSAKVASEWMQSLSMFGYGLPGVFTGALYRPPAPFPVSSNYRGFAPRPRGRGRGRGIGIRGSRSGYDTYYNTKHDRYDDENENGYYHRSSRGRYESSIKFVLHLSQMFFFLHFVIFRNRSRSSSSYSRSRSRSRGRR